MTVKFGLLPKLALADIALKRILVRVHPFVLLQYRLRTQTFAALIALILAVNKVVIFQPKYGLELFAATVAFQHVPGANVLLELYQFFEILTAHTAQIRILFFGRVQPNMIVEGLLRIEHFAAIMAAKRQRVLAIAERVQQHLFRLLRQRRISAFLAKSAIFVRDSGDGGVFDDETAFGAFHRFDVVVDIFGNQNRQKVTGIWRHKIEIITNLGGSLFSNPPHSAWTARSHCTHDR